MNGRPVPRPGIGEGTDRVVVGTLPPPRHRRRADGAMVSAQAGQWSSSNAVGLHQSQYGRRIDGAVVRAQTGQ